MFYLLLLVLAITTLWLQKNSNINKKILEFFLMFIIFGPAAFRGDVGVDTLNYEPVYELMASLSNFNWHTLMLYEPVTPIFMFLSGQLIYSYTFFLIIFALTQACLFSRATLNMQSREIFILFYLINAHLIFSFAALRFGISFLLFINALRDKEDGNIKLMVFWSILSIFSHYSILIFLPLLIDFKFDMSLFWRALVIFPLFYYIYNMSGDYIVDKINRYGDEGFNNKISTVGILMTLIMFGALVFYKNKARLVVSSIFLFSAVLMLSSINPIMYRLVDPVVILLMYSVFYKIKFRMSFSIRPILIGVIFIAFYFSFSSVSRFYDEKKFLTNSDVEVSDFTFIPYKTFLSTNYRKNDGLLYYSGGNH